jgi:hypothetical protein
MATSLTLIGCRDFDYEARVVNSTGMTYLVRVAEGGRQAGKYDVGVVPPGFDGIAVRWTGDQGAPIELLDEECRKLGDFVPTGARLTVPEVAGVVASVEQYRLFPGSGGDESHPVALCGGSGPSM